MRCKCKLKNKTLVVNITTQGSSCQDWYISWLPGEASDITGLYESVILDIKNIMRKITGKYSLRFQCKIDLFTLLAYMLIPQYNVTPLAYIIKFS